MDSVDIIIELVKRLMGKDKKADTPKINEIIIKELNPHDSKSVFEDPKSIKAEKYI